MNYTFENRKDVYTDLWAKMDIRPNRLDLVTAVADRLISLKSHYDPIEATTGVPWYVIALMHLRESDCDFRTHLHNGDPLSGRTYHVPAGRPIAGSPPFTFEESAVDALRQKGYDKIKDWSIERIAYTLEKYNGFGYVQYGVNSPYLWASTDLYTRGKYIRDGVYSASTVDVQLGTMAVIKVIFDKIGNPTEKPIAQVAVEAPKAEPKRPTTSELAQVSRKTWWTRVLQYFGIGTGGTTMLLKAADTINLDSTKSTLDSIKSIAKDYGASIAIIVCTGMVCVTMIIIKYAKDDVQEGRNVPSKLTEKEE